ncbi:hypothetical protein QUA81_21720 [Microcoleus sp. F6_B4]
MTNPYSPQQKPFFVEQASCLFLIILQHLRSPSFNQGRSHAYQLTTKINRSDRKQESIEHQEAVV